jgi:hypothetical protein
MPEGNSSAFPHYRQRMGIEMDPTEAKLLRRAIIASGIFSIGVEGLNSVEGTAKKACELDREIERLTQREE